MADFLHGSKKHRVFRNLPPEAVEMK